MLHAVLSVSNGMLNIRHVGVTGAGRYSSRCCGVLMLLPCLFTRNILLFHVDVGTCSMSALEVALCSFCWHAVPRQGCMVMTTLAPNSAPSYQGWCQANGWWLATQSQLVGAKQALYISCCATWRIGSWRPIPGTFT